MRQKNSKNYEDNKFLAIISDSWEEFKQRYPSFNTLHYNKVVESALGPANPVFGFRQFFCLNCGEDSRPILTRYNRIVPQNPLKY